MCVAAMIVFCSDLPGRFWSQSYFRIRCIHECWSIFIDSLSLCNIWDSIILLDIVCKTMSPGHTKFFTVFQSKKNEQHPSIQKPTLSSRQIRNSSKLLYRNLFPYFTYLSLWFSSPILVALFSPFWNAKKDFEIVSALDIFGFPLGSNERTP